MVTLRVTPGDNKRVTLTQETLGQSRRKMKGRGSTRGKGYKNTVRGEEQ